MHWGCPSPWLLDWLVLLVHLRHLLQLLDFRCCSSTWSCVPMASGLLLLLGDGLLLVLQGRVLELRHLEICHLLYHLLYLLHHLAAVLLLPFLE